MPPALDHHDQRFFAFSRTSASLKLSEPAVVPPGRIDVHDDGGGL